MNAVIYTRVSTKEQVEDYAKRKNIAVTEAERWLGTILNY